MFCSYARGVAGRTYRVANFVAFVVDCFHIPIGFGGVSGARPDWRGLTGSAVLMALVVFPQYGGGAF